MKNVLLMIYGIICLWVQKSSVIQMMVKKEKSTPEPTHMLKANPFEYTQNNGIDMELLGTGGEILKSVTTSVWTLFMAISASGFLISLTCCGLRAMASPKSWKDVKEHISAKVMVFMFVCAMVFILSTIFEIARKFG